MSDNHIDIKLIIPSDFAGKRVDQALAQLLEDYSRARLQQWIDAGAVKLNGAVCKRKDKLSGGETVHIQTTLEEEGDWQPQNLPLGVIHEDDDIIVLNKPAGLVVHPGAGVKDGTLINALLYHYPELAVLPRAGIVHRLDKDTTGLMVVARSVRAHTSLSQQLQTKTASRVYHAVVNGELIAGGTVDAAMGRHPRNRLKMAVVESGKPAVTHYRVLARYTKQTLIRCDLETGRTHQIRVHMAHVGHPIFGDPLYSPHMPLPKQLSDDDKAFLRAFKRQALHAKILSFVHPHSGETVTFECPYPDDFETLNAILKKEAAHD